MADTRFQVTFGKCEEDQKVYQFLKSRTNGSALVRLLVQNYMISTGAWNGEVNNMSEIIQTKIVEQQQEKAEPKEENQTSKETQKDTKEAETKATKGNGTKDNGTPKRKKFGNFNPPIYKKEDEQ